MNSFDLSLLIPPVVLLVFWIFGRESKYFCTIFLVLWGLSVLVFGFAGSYQWKEDHEVSKVGAVLMNTASTWFVAPFLMMSSKKKWSPIASIVATIILPIVGVLACFLLLMVTGQVTGL